ncbi:O-methyltransferase domain [Dillenia turbinata]|uniref:O-methyltransferase domain n=1 Tax=Dillenia turbinata TaxID=194707 RepID=A0AAN8VJ73_9MAGN
MFEAKLFFDMLMMVNVGGRERTEKEWKKLFFESGFSRYRIKPILGDCMEISELNGKKCAIKLGIPDTIHNHTRPITLPELVSALQVSPTRSSCLGALSPQFNTLFNEAMTSDSQLAKVVIEDCKETFVGLNSLVDLGGSAGIIAGAVSASFPHLLCTVFDLPHVIANVPENKDLDYVGGDIFRGIPSADAILFKRSNSKQWEVDHLQHCDDNTAEDEMLETKLFFDMLMMVAVTGRERSEKDWKKLFLEAGSSRYKIKTILGLRFLFSRVLLVNSDRLLHFLMEANSFVILEFAFCLCIVIFPPPHHKINGRQEGFQFSLSQDHAILFLLFLYVILALSCTWSEVQVINVSFHLRYHGKRTTSKKIRLQHYLTMQLLETRRDSKEILVELHTKLEDLTSTENSILHLKGAKKLLSSKWALQVMLLRKNSSPLDLRISLPVSQESSHRI